MPRRSLADATDDRLAKFATNEDSKVLTMLNTRVPKTMLKTIKVWTVSNDTTIREFVTGAISEKMQRMGIE